MHGTCKTTKQGFTLIELLVVIALIGLLGAIALPIIGRKTERKKREVFIAKLNGLVHFGCRLALRNHTIYQITIDPQKHTVILSEETEKMPVTPLQGHTQKTMFEWPEQYEIKQIFIEGHPEKLDAAFWFFIIPEGMAQEIIINFTDTKDLKNDRPRECALVLNPFYVQFTVYDTFQKP